MDFVLVASGLHVCRVRVEGCFKSKFTYSGLGFGGSGIKI